MSSPTTYIIAAGLGIAGFAWWRTRQEQAKEEQGKGSSSTCDGIAALAEQLGGKAAGDAARAACGSGALDVVKDLVLGAGDALFTSSDEAQRENLPKNGGSRTSAPPALRALMRTAHQTNYSESGAFTGVAKWRWADPVSPAWTLAYGNGCVPYKGAPAWSKCAAGTAGEAIGGKGAWGTGTSYATLMQNASNGRPAPAGKLGVFRDFDNFTRRHPTRAEWDAEVARLRSGRSGLGPNPFVAFPKQLKADQEGWWLRGVPVVGPKGSSVAVDHRTGELVLRASHGVPPASGEHDTGDYVVDDQGRRDHRGLEDT